MRRIEVRKCIQYVCLGCAEMDNPIFPSDNTHLSEGGAYLHLQRHLNNGHDIDEDLFAELKIAVTAEDTFKKALA